MKATISFGIEATADVGISAKEVRQNLYDLFFVDLRAAKQSALMEYAGKNDAASLAMIKSLQSDLRLIEMAFQSYSISVDLPYWKQVFPKFDLDVELPEGFEDSTGTHDSCPSFLNKELDVILYVDYADPTEREYEETTRFSLQKTENGMFPATGERETLLDTDSYQEILDSIEELKATSQLRM